MRIGHFVSFGIGGADRAAFRLIEAQKLAGLSPLVLASESSRPSAQRITRDQDPQGLVLSIEDDYRRLGVPVHIVEDNRQIKDFQLDILHTHRSGEDHFLLPGLGEAGSARVVVETNFHGHLKTPADVRVFPSETLLRFRRIEHQKNFHVIPNPVMPQLTAKNLRGAWGLGDEIAIGRLSRSDRSTYSPKLLLAYKVLKSAGKKVRLVWAGASSMAKRDAALLGLNDIIWLPTSADATQVSMWLNSFDIYCHVPRLGETFGNTVAEAMMHAKPVLSLKGSMFYPQAQFEVLSDNAQTATSFISFVRKLSRFVSDAQLRRDLSARNLCRAEEEFSAGSVERRYSAVYEGALTR